MTKIKAVRVNHSTKAEEILATMHEEMPSEYYFFRKQFGGKQKYYKYEDQMLDKALEEKKDQYTDIFSHISKAGNRWMIYTQAQYFPKAVYAQAFQFSFIYYETMASCGAFFPMFSQSEYRKKAKKRSKTEAKPTGVIIFTSHFFYQMSERTGKAYRSKELIKEFISTKCEHAMQADEDGEVVAKFSGGYGFGVQLSENPNVIEIRTYLKDSQLNGKQRRKVEKLNAFFELSKDGTFISEVSLHTAVNQCKENIEERIKDKKKKMEAIKALGLEKRIMLHSLCHASFVKVVKKLLTPEVTPEQMVVMGHYISHHVGEFVVKYEDVDLINISKEENQILCHDIIDVMTETAKELKFRSLTKERITQAFREILNEADKNQELKTK